MLNSKSYFEYQSDDIDFEKFVLKFTNIIKDGLNNIVFRDNDNIFIGKCYLKDIGNFEDSFKTIDAEVYKYNTHFTERYNTTKCHVYLDKKRISFLNSSNNQDLHEKYLQYIIDQTTPLIRECRIEEILK